MSDRALRRLHDVTLAIGVPLLAAVLVLSLRNDSFGEDGAFIGLALLMIVGYITIASVTIRRQPRNPVGWLLLVIGFAFLVGGGSDEFVKYVYVTEPGALPLGEAVAWVNGWVFVLFVGAIPVLLLVFPTGRLLGRSWRPVLWLIVASVVGLAAVTILQPGNLVTDHAAIPNPTGVPALGPALDVLVWVTGMGLLLSAILSAVGLIVRFRRSSGDERQQVRWLASVSAVGLALLVLVLVTSIGLEGGETSRLNDLVFFGFFLVLAFGFPAAIAIAILKYRLYDLDIVIKKTLVFGIVVVLLVAALAFVALVAGALVGRTGFAESSRASFVYAFILGVLTFPIWRVARRLADRIVYGGRASPYSVLSDFSERMSEAFSTDDVLPRMARVVAEAVGAQHVQIWLRVGSAARPAGAWPEASTHESISLVGSELPELGPGDAFEVRHQGELLGAIVLTMPANDPMNPSKERLVRDLAAQAGLVLRNVRLIEELRASRQRLVAAQDQERRRLERNIHDGAQQQLVALAVKLRLADSLVERDPAGAHRLLEQLQTETNQALQDLRDLARGIYPPLLADEGLGAALAAQAKKATLPVTVDADGVGRHAQDVEAAVYFTCLEALGNVAKHAVGATRAEIRLGRDDGVLRFSVADDGAGFDPATSSGGTGLQGIADRLEAIGGSLQVESAPGSGTVLRGVVPVGAER